MNALRQALADYLAVRRVLGYKLVRAEKLLAQFLTYVEDRGEDRLTTETALAWATLPPEAHRSWASIRLSVVRHFAVHLRGIDPATEVPPVDLLPGRSCRATPYLYSEEEIAALIDAAGTLRTPHRVATYRTLIALLTVTGIRIGEAINLDRSDFDAVNGLLIIRRGKFGKSRELPLHPSAVTALGKYLRRGDRPRQLTPALLSPLRAPGCSIPTSSRPSADWSAKSASSLARLRAGPGSMTCVTASPSVLFLTAIAMVAIRKPGSLCCRPISATSTLARHTGTSRPLRSC